MTDNATTTTTTRDEAVPALSEITASVVVAMSKRLGAVEPFNELTDDDIAAMFRDGLAAYLASAPALASGGVDAVAVKALEWRRHPEDGSLSFEGQNDQREYLERALHPFGAYFLMKKDGRYSIRSSINSYADYDEFDAPELARADAEAKHAALVLASLSPAATPVSEGEPVGEAELMRQGGEYTVAVFKADIVPPGTKLYALAKPSSSPAGGDVVETLVPLKWRHVDVEQFEAHSIIGTYDVCGQHWSFVPALKKAGAEMGSLDEARKAAQSHRDMYGPQPRRAALSQSTSAGRVE